MKLSLNKSMLICNCADRFYLSHIGFSIVLSVVFFLSACQYQGSADNVLSVSIPPSSKHEIVDFRVTECAQIWHNEVPEVLENPSFWLKFMDCSNGLSRQQAREIAQNFSITSWSQLWKQSVLLSHSEPTVAERRQILAQISSYDTGVPTSLRPLLQLWREQQVNQLALLDERKRYQQLLESTDNTIDSLKTKEVHQQHQLDELTKKLAGLTDIERQLSSRKQRQNEIPAEQANSPDDLKDPTKQDIPIKDQDTEQPKSSEPARIDVIQNEPAVIPMQPKS